MKRFALPLLMLVACAGCDDPIARALGLGGNGGCKCSPERMRPAPYPAPIEPAPPRRKPCPPNGPCPLNHVHDSRPGAAK